MAEFTLLPSPRLKQGRFVDENTVVSAWTPTITFATPGDLAVAYSSQDGAYWRTRNEVRLSWFIATNTFTHTTASGLLNITGLPFKARDLDGAFYLGALAFQGITMGVGGYTQFAPRLGANVQLMTVLASGSGNALAFVQASDMPTGGTVNLYGTLVYEMQF